MPNVSSNAEIAAVPVHRTHSVTAVSTQILAAKAGRKFLLIQNIGAKDALVNLAGGTPGTVGIKLAPMGTILMDKYVSGAAIMAMSSESVAVLVSVEA